MGSFNSTCVVSGMPLGAGDKVRILLLNKNPYDEGDAHRACYMHGWWIPRTFPLKAEYNDYGSVENVEEGVAKDLWLDTLKFDLIPQGTGDNTCHDVPTDFDMSFEAFLEALWENRVLVAPHAPHGRPRPPIEAAAIPEPPHPDEHVPAWLPTVTRVKTALTGLPASEAYGQEGFLVDDLAYGCIRVRWVSSGPDRNATDKLVDIQQLLPMFATVITAGSGNYSHGSPELRVFPQPGADRVLYRNDRDDNKPVPVSYAMIREDVWQALLGMNGTVNWSGETMPTVDQYRTALCTAYESGLAQVQRRKQIVEGLKTATGEDYAILREALMVNMMADLDLDRPASNLTWIIDRRDIMGTTVKLSKQWEALLESNVSLADAQGFINSVAELSHVHHVLQNIRFIWRPSATCGPQVGDFRDHVEFFEAMLQVSRVNAKAWDEADTWVDKLRTWWWQLTGRIPRSFFVTTANDEPQDDEAELPEFDFTLTLQGDPEAEGRMDALFEAGCGDAAFIKRDGTWYADFTREAETFEAAVQSAIEQIESVSGLKVTSRAQDLNSTEAQV